MTEASNRVTLQIGSDRYIGFKDLEITIGIEQLAGEFSLTCSDRWALKGERLPILEGMGCSVLIGETPVITGFIDEVTPSYDPESHSLQIRGRDATGDLVDSAAQTDGQGWSNRTLLEVARDVCKPFGIPVSVDAVVGAAFGSRIAAGARKSRRAQTGAVFRKQAIHPGETAMEVLSRAARLRGFLLVSDGLGGLTITRAGSARATRTLAHGIDIKAGSATRSQRDRFRTYRVIGQDEEQAYGDQSDAAQQVKAEATDPEIRASRVTVLDPGDAIDAASAAMLARWVAANRRAAGNPAQVSVRGWLDGDRPWRPNTLVPVSDPWLRLDGEYLIAQVTFTISTRLGETATLRLVPPEAYVPEPLRERLGADDDEAGL